jgi:cell division protein FtsQ
VSRTGTTTSDRTGRSRRSGSGRPAPSRGAAGRGGAGRAGTGSVTPLPSRRSPARSRRRRPLQIGLAVLVAVALLWLLLAGPLLAVRSVNIDGLRTLPADQVREAAGIDDGTPLLRVDVGAAESRLAELPQIASVEVTRGWPDSVVITLVERVPVAVVGPPEERSLIDADGVLFDLVTGTPPDGVVPLDVEDPRPGDPTTLAALAAVSALPVEVREGVAGAAATGPDDITLTLDDGTLVVWGDATRSAAKAAALGGLVEQIGSGALEPADTIDVSTPDAVVLR